MFMKRSSNTIVRESQIGNRAVERSILIDSLPRIEHDTMVIPDFDPDYNYPVVKNDLVCFNDDSSSSLIVGNFSGPVADFEEPSNLIPAPTYEEEDKAYAKKSLGSFKYQLMKEYHKSFKGRTEVLKFGEPEAELSECNQGVSLVPPKIMAFSYLPDEGWVTDSFPHYEKQSLDLPGNVHHKAYGKGYLLVMNYDMKPKPFCVSLGSGPRFEGEIPSRSAFCLNTDMRKEKILLLNDHLSRTSHAIVDLPLASNHRDYLVITRLQPGMSSFQELQERTSGYHRFPGIDNEALTDFGPGNVCRLLFQTIQMKSGANEWSSSLGQMSLPNHVNIDMNAADAIMNGIGGVCWAGEIPDDAVLTKDQACEFTGETFPGLSNGIDSLEGELGEMKMSEWASIMWIAIFMNAICTHMKISRQRKKINFKCLVVGVVLLTSTFTLAQELRGCTDQSFCSYPYEPQNCFLNEQVFICNSCLCQPYEEFFLDCETADDCPFQSPPTVVSCYLGKCIITDPCVDVVTTPAPCATSTPTATSSPSPTVSNSPTPHPTPGYTFSSTPSPSVTSTVSISSTASPSHHVVAKHERISSSGPQMTGLFLSIIISLSEAYKCVGTRLAVNYAEIQLEGNTFHATCGGLCDYLFDSVNKTGYGDPIYDGDNCEYLYHSIDYSGRSETHLSRSLFARELVSNDDIVFVYLEDNMLTLRFATEAERVVLVKALGLLFEVDASGASIDISLPLEVLQTSNTVIVQTFTDEGLESTNIFKIVGKRDCVVQDCWLCNLSNWDCIPKILKALLILTAIVLGITAIVLIIYGSKMLLSIVAMIYKGGLCFVSTFYYFSYNSIKRGGKWFDRMREGANIGRVVVIIAMASGVACCDDSFLLSTTQSKCVTDGSTRFCDVAIDNAISIRGPGFSTCVNIVDGDDPIGLLKLTFEANGLTCDLVDGYYTSERKEYVKSVFRCPGAGNCTANCDDINRNADGEFGLEDFLQMPGETSCQRRCQGVACGCFLPSLGCVYDTYSILPLSPMVRVDRIGSCVSTPVFTYSLVGGDGETLQSGEIDMYSSYGEDNFMDITILTELSEDKPSDLPNSLVQTDTFSVMVDASYLNVPEIGKIGDIQSMNKSGLQTGQFIYDPEILMRRDQKAKYDRLVFRQSAIESLQHEKKLPTSHGGLIWSTMNEEGVYTKKIYAVDTRPSPLLMGFRTKVNVTLSKEVQIVCPKMSFKEAEGCHSCSTGAKVIIKGLSTCLDGSVIVSGKDLANTIITLERVEKDFELYLYTNESDYKATWKIGSSELKIDIELQEGLVLNQETLLYSNNKLSGAQTFKKGHWKWWEYGLFSVACLLAIGFGLLLIWFLGPVVISLLSAVRSTVAKKIDKTTMKKVLKVKKSVIVDKTPAGARFRQREVFR